MKREHFVEVVEGTLDSLPQEFRSRIQNVAVLVEALPPDQPSSQPGKQSRLLLGIFHGVPTTKKSVFDLPSGPDHIVLWGDQKVCWLTIVGRGETGGERPHKRLSKFDPFRTIGGKGQGRP